MNIIFLCTIFVAVVYGDVSHLNLQEDGYHYQLPSIPFQIRNDIEQQQSSVINYNEQYYDPYEQIQFTSSKFGSDSGVVTGPRIETNLHEDGYHYQKPSVQFPVPVQHHVQPIYPSQYEQRIDTLPQALHRQPTKAPYYAVPTETPQTQPPVYAAYQPQAATYQTQEPIFPPYQPGTDQTAFPSYQAPTEQPIFPPYQPATDQTTSPSYQAPTEQPIFPPYQPGTDQTAFPSYQTQTEVQKTEEPIFPPYQPQTEAQQTNSPTTEFQTQAPLIQTNTRIDTSLEEDGYHYRQPTIEFNPGFLRDPTKPIDPAQNRISATSASNVEGPTESSTPSESTTEAQFPLKEIVSTQLPLQEDPATQSRVELIFGGPTESLTQNSVPLPLDQFNSAPTDSITISTTEPKLDIRFETVQPSREPAPAHSFGPDGYNYKVPSRQFRF